MDLSGIIFVVLALGWAGYLIPMVLKHQDDLDKSRPVREFSGSLRVLGRSVVPKAVSAPDVAPLQAPRVQAPAPVRTVTREAARSAARRRRRVLALLLTTLAVVTLVSYLGYAPWFTTAIPGALIVVFLVTARLTVRAQQGTRAAASHVVPASVEPVATQRVPDVGPAETHADLTTEDTEGIDRAALDAALSAEPVLDEGGLWDPLPVTLPTYVNKARARRTVRTIEITGEGSSAITSSGHDAADSALAAEARESEQAELPIAETEQKAAGA